MKRVTDKLNLTPVRTKNRWRRSVRYLILSLVISSAMASCISEDFGQGNPNTGDGKEKEVVFKVAVPGTAAPKPQLRSIGAEQENTIETVDVLAFRIDGGNEFFDYYSQAQRSSSADEGQSSQSFTVKVRIKTYEQRFVVITNAHTKVMELIGSTDWGQDTPKADMLSRLTLTFGAEGDKWKVISPSNFTAFPMWGESAKTTITGSTSTVGSVPMLRMIAKINVQLDETVTGLTDKFKVKSVHLYNTNTTGHIVPSTTASHWDETDHIALKATVPTGATRYQGPLAYSDFTAPGIEDVAMKGAIYTFETKAVAQDKPLEATCIVVGGLYDTDTNPTYYRLDFFESDGKTYRDILRNHQYIANIIAVKGRGYPTEEEAFKAKAVNMVATILEWDEGGMGDIVFDGQFMLSVSKGEFNFSRDAKTGEEDNNVLNVFTDYTTTTGTSGWKIEKIVDAADGTTPVNWLTLNPTTGTANVKTKVVLTFGENNTPAIREANVIIAAGRLRYTVKVTQSLTPDIGISIFNPLNSATLTELVFAAAKDVAPAAQMFRVDFAPKAGDLLVSSSMVGANLAFTFGSTSDVITTETLSNLDGTKSYTIQPTVLTSAQLDPTTGNPFLERTSKIEYTVSNGVSYESKSIFLRQLVYNTLAKAEDYYILDNTKTHSFSIRSNTAWKISDISDLDGILDLASFSALLNQTGGYNTTATGQTINFKLISDPTGAKSGKIVTLTLSDPTGHMTDVIVILKGVTCGTDGIAVAQTIGTTQYLTHKYGEKCWMVENLKEGTVPGTASATYYSTLPANANGYYYTRAQANNICPTGWHLPTYEEGVALKANINAGVNAPHSKWWAGSDGASNGAFAGAYAGTWSSWGSYGYWHYGTGGQYLYSYTSGMLSSTTNGNWFSVRCVQD